MNKIVFMGTPSYAEKILKKMLDEQFDICAVLTQEDKAVGRKQILTSSAVKNLALKHDLQIFTPKSLKDEVLQKQLQDLKPDFIVVAAYGKILPKAILDLAPCINLHASLLPKYRGASPIQSAILNGEKTSGVCTMLMNEGLDTGDILQSAKLEIKDKKANQVFDELGDLAAVLCVQTLRNFHNIKPIAQDETQASFCKKIKKEDGLLDLYEQSASLIYQKFLAFYPWPGVFLKNGLKFIDIELLDENEHDKIGEILALEKESFLLACKQGTLRIKKLQESGKKILDARTYLNGKRIKNGAYLY